MCVFKHIQILNYLNLFVTPIIWFVRDEQRSLICDGCKDRVTPLDQETGLKELSQVLVNHEVQKVKSKLPAFSILMAGR